MPVIAEKDKAIITFEVWKVLLTSIKATVNIRDKFKTDIEHTDTGSYCPSLYN